MEFKKLTDMWCFFVLKEGLMPTQIVRALRNSEKKQRDLDYRKIAAILSERESFGRQKADYVSPEDKDIISLARDSFKTDKVLVDWLKEVDVVLNIIKNTDPEKMSDLLIGALTSFIRGCPLVSEGHKQAYLLFSGPLTRFRASKYNLPLQVEFQEYLEKQGKYSPGSIMAYKSSLTFIARHLNTNIWEIKDLETIKSIQKQLEDDEEYIKTNKEKHGALSNALARYTEFLEQQSEPSTNIRL